MARLPRGGNGNTELKLIENERERAVVLSKRRNGLFKKADELATLCGVKIAIVLFSIGGKPISYGSPNVRSVVNQYLNIDQDQQLGEINTRPVNSYHESTNTDQNKELNEVLERLANAKKEGQMLDEIRKRSFGGKKTHKEYVYILGYDELIQQKGKKKELKRVLEATCRPFDKCAEIVLEQSDIDRTTQSRKNLKIKLEEDAPEDALLRCFY